MAAYFLVLDLMVDEFGQVKILELQDGDRSGFSGYQKSYQQSMRSIVNDHMRDKGDIWGREPILFSFMCDNKAGQATFAYPAIADIFPKQKSFAYVARQEALADIHTDFPKTETLVIKVPDAARGEGVFFADKSSMFIHGIPEDRSLNLFGSFFRSAQENSVLPAQGHVVVQDMVQAREITVEGNRFRPTIRTALTVHWDDDNWEKEPEICIHGSYYKLPKPLDSSNSFDVNKVKSDVHSGIGAAKIEDYDAAQIQRQIPSAIQKLFHYTMIHDAEELILEKLTSHSAGDIISAINYMRELDNVKWDFSDGFIKEYMDLSQDIGDRIPHAKRIMSLDWRHERISSTIVNLCHVTEEEVAQTAQEIRADWQEQHKHEFERIDRLCQIFRICSDIEEDYVADVSIAKQKHLIKKRAVKEQAPLKIAKFRDAGIGAELNLDSFARVAPSKIWNIINRETSHLNDLNTKFNKNFNDLKVAVIIAQDRIMQATPQNIYPQRLVA